MSEGTLLTDLQSSSISIDPIHPLFQQKVKLELYNGSTYQVIAENLANAGSYSWNTAPPRASIRLG